MARREFYSERDNSQFTGQSPRRHVAHTMPPLSLTLHKTSAKILRLHFLQKKELNLRKPIWQIHARHGVRRNVGAG